MAVIYISEVSCFFFMFIGMINKLSLDERGDDMTFVSAVATSLFADNTTNWGRIVSLVAFGAVVCQHLKEKGRDNCVDLVSQEISSYLLSNQRDWLVKNNAWVRTDSFEDLQKSSWLHNFPYCPSKHFVFS